jgi:hypothetical protein
MLTNVSLLDDAVVDADAPAATAPFSVCSFIFSSCERREELRFDAEREAAFI